MKSSKPNASKYPRAQKQAEEAAAKATGTGDHPYVGMFHSLDHLMPLLADVLGPDIANRPLPLADETGFRAFELPAKEMVKEEVTCQSSPFKPNPLIGDYKPKCGDPPNSTTTYIEPVAKPDVVLVGYIDRDELRAREERRERTRRKCLTWKEDASLREMIRRTHTKVIASTTALLPDRDDYPEEEIVL